MEALRCDYDYFKNLYAFLNLIKGKKMIDSIVEQIQGLDPKSTKGKKTLEALNSLLALQNSHRDVAIETNKLIDWLANKGSANQLSSFENALRSANNGLFRNANIFVVSAKDEKMLALLNQISILSAMQNYIDLDLNRSIAQGRLQKSEKAIEASGQFIMALMGLTKEVRGLNDSFAKLGYGTKEHKERFASANRNKEEEKLPQPEEKSKKDAPTTDTKKTTASKAKTTAAAKKEDTAKTEAIVADNNAEAKAS